MDRKDAATRQDVIANSVNHEIFTLANSAASPGQFETLLASELDHDLIAWPRQYLETYLDSDETGRVPLDQEQLQDVLEAAFDRDAAILREFLEELAAARTPLGFGDSTLQVTKVCRSGERVEYELLFDPRDCRDLKHLVDKLDVYAWVKQNGPMKQLAPGEYIECAQTDSGTFRGKIIAATESNLIQQITSHSAVVHEKNLLDMIPAVGETVRIAYSNNVGCVVAVKQRAKTRELAR